MRTVSRLLDIFIEPLFRTDPEGRQVFFPWGVWAAGYVLPDAVTAESMRRTLRTTWLVFFLVGIPLAILLMPLRDPVDLLPVIAASAIVSLAMLGWFRWLARDLQRSSMKLPLREAQDAQTRAMGRTGILAMMVLSLILMALGVATLVTAGHDRRWIGGLLIGMFGLCLVVLAWHWRRLSRLEAAPGRS
ncbi:MAG: hypothetical protein SFW09_01825 [Hyphomicrobiaceae bacterium]|nr:hypothetical protein [Hyphomicrobiaceae bacterium]